MLRAALCPPVLVSLDIYPRFVVALICARLPPQTDPMLEVDLNQQPQQAEAEIAEKIVSPIVILHGL
jgi:hypothetical protein